MKVFSCSRCGAPLDVPEAATTVRCAFCGAATPTGARAPETAHVAPRPALAIDTLIEPHPPWGGHDLQPLPPPAANAQVVWVVVGVVSMIMIGMTGALVFARVETPTSYPVSDPAPVDLPPVDPPPVEPPAPPVAPVITPAMQRPLGMMGVQQRTRWLRSKGCKSMVAPTTVSGPQTLESKFAANGKCITVLASAQNASTTLKLTMTAPSGAAVPTPAPAHALELSVCPRERGQYPTEIEASDQGQYAVSVLECGRSIAEQPQ